MFVQILTPSTGLSRMEYTYSLAKLIMYFCKNKLLPECDRQMIDFHSIEGSGISANRERLVVDALNTECTHILFIDEDMGFNPNALHILASRRQRIVGCNYPMRGPTNEFTALSLDKKTRIFTREKSTGIEPVFYTGFGFCLIERSVFEIMKQPWFPFGYNIEGKYYTTEDAVFSTLLHTQTDIPWYVDHDASKLISHVGNHKFVWNEVSEKQKEETKEGIKEGQKNDIVGSIQP